MFVAASCEVSALHEYVVAPPTTKVITRSAWCGSAMVEGLPAMRQPFYCGNDFAIEAKRQRTDESRNIAPSPVASKGNYTRPPLFNSGTTAEGCTRNCSDAAVAAASDDIFAIADDPPMGWTSYLRSNTMSKAEGDLRTDCANSAAPFGGKFENGDTTVGSVRAVEEYLNGWGTTSSCGGVDDEAVSKWGLSFSQFTETAVVHEKTVSHTVEPVPATYSCADEALELPRQDSTLLRNRNLFIPSTTIPPPEDDSEPMTPAKLTSSYDAGWKMAASKSSLMSEESSFAECCPWSLDMQPTSNALLDSVSAGMGEDDNLACPLPSGDDERQLSIDALTPECRRLLRCIPRKSREAMTPSDEAAFRTCHPQYSRICYILMHLGYDIRLGETGRAMLKKEISRRLKNDAQLRERCVSIVCRLKNANVLQLLQMAEISGCLLLGLRISSTYWKENARKQRPGGSFRRGACMSQYYVCEDGFRGSGLPGNDETVRAVGELASSERSTADLSVANYPLMVCDGLPSFCHHSAQLQTGTTPDYVSPSSNTTGGTVSSHPCDSQRQFPLQQYTGNSSDVIVGVSPFSHAPPKSHCNGLDMRQQESVVTALAHVDNSSPFELTSSCGVAAAATTQMQQQESSTPSTAYSLPLTSPQADSVRNAACSYFYSSDPIPYVSPKFPQSKRAAGPHENEPLKRFSGATDFWASYGAADNGNIHWLDDKETGLSSSCFPGQSSSHMGQPATSASAAPTVSLADTSTPVTTAGEDGFVGGANSQWSECSSSTSNSTSLRPTSSAIHVEEVSYGDLYCGNESW